MSTAYLDSSAAVKLIVYEAESSALRSWLRGRTTTSSVLLRVEVIRAVRHQGPPAVARAVRLIEPLELLRLSRIVMERAISVEPMHLRTLDAIHLATAALMTGSSFAFVSYDERLIHAADQLGLRVVSPT